MKCNEVKLFHYKLSSPNHKSKTFQPCFPRYVFKTNFTTFGHTVYQKLSPIIIPVYHVFSVLMIDRKFGVLSTPKSQLKAYFRDP